MEFSHTTIQSRCQTALQLVKEYQDSPFGFWVAVGKLESWANDDFPPIPSVSISRIPDVHGLIYVSTCVNVYSNAQGIIVTENQNYEPVNSTDVNVVSSYKANKVYIEALLNPSDFPASSSYRAKGLCKNVTFTSNPSSLIPGTFVPINNVSSYFLDWVSLHSPIECIPGTTHVIQIIKEF
jgi:hypothetical protein